VQNAPVGVFSDAVRIGSAFGVHADIAEARRLTTPVWANVAKGDGRRGHNVGRHIILYGAVRRRIRAGAVDPAYRGATVLNLVEDQLKLVAGEAHRNVGWPSMGVE